MLELTGIWRLLDSAAWDEAGRKLAAPYGAHPIGQLTFTTHKRMLAALCNGDPDAPPGRGYSSYGGPYTFDGARLVTTVDVASDPSRIGGQQVRDVAVEGVLLVLKPPPRAYGCTVQRRELRWERVWKPGPGAPA